MLLPAIASLALARLASADVPLYTDLEAFQAGAMGQHPKQTFHSSDVTGSIFQVNALDASDPRLDQHPYLFTNGDYGGHSGPFIFSARDLSLVWTYLGPKHTTSVQVGVLDGEPVVTSAAFEPDLAVMVFNQRYDLKYTVGAVGRYKGHSQDPHEAFITDHDSVVLVVCPKEKHDMTLYGGKDDQSVRNCLIQDIDPRSNDLLFESASLDHFTLNDTYMGSDGDYSGVEDFAHINSGQRTPHGDYLIGARHLCAVWLVDGQTGAVKWILGGKRNMFRDITDDGGTAEFLFQHDARLIAPNRITLFDNHYLANGYCDTATEDPCSRGLELEIDVDAMTVRRVAEWSHPQNLRSASRGGVTRLDNGNTLVAWGQNPMYTEHAPDGTVLMDVQRGQVLAIEHGIVGLVAYRAYKADWVGMPPWGPNISAETDADGTTTTVYVSWNGATEVDRYIVMTSDRADNLTNLHDYDSESPRTGFETEIPLATGKTPPAFARVAAYNRAGEAIGVSPVVDVATGRLTTDDLYDKMHEQTPDREPTVPAAAADKPVDDHRHRRRGWVLGVTVLLVLAAVALAMYYASRYLRRTAWWGSRSWSPPSLMELRQGWSKVATDDDDDDDDDDALHEDKERGLGAELTSRYRES